MFFNASWNTFTQYLSVQLISKDQQINFTFALGSSCSCLVKLLVDMEADSRVACEAENDEANEESLVLLFSKL